MSKSRTRVVNFRVTDEEFQQLKLASTQQGARCLSDFARCVMLGQHSFCPVSGSHDDRLLSFDRRVTAIERSMARLVEALSSAQVPRVSPDN